MTTQITPSSPHTERMWRAGLVLQSKRATNSSQFSQDEESVENSALPIVERPGSGRGDTVELTFSRPNEDEIPKTDGDETLGKESGTQYWKDSVQVRYFKFDGAVPNYIYEQQMVSFNRKASEVERIGCQWGYTHEKVVLNQLAGATHLNLPDDDYALGAGNVITAQDVDHILYAEGASAHTTPEAVAADADSILTTEIIDELVMRAVSRDWVKWPLAPCKTPFGEMYVFWVSSEGYKQIMNNSADSDIYDLERAMIQGGMDAGKAAPINGEGFIYNNTLVLRTDFLPQAPDSSDGSTGVANTKANVFMGARSGHYVYAEGFTGGDHLGYSEHLTHRRLSILADCVYGFKRTIVDGQSWGSFQVVSYVSK